MLRELRGVCADGKPEVPSICNNAGARIERCERILVRLHSVMTREQRSELKIARALYLRMLLSSASARLHGWGDHIRLEETPPSHLLEWLSHDLEQLELSSIESSMTPQECVWYLQASFALGQLHE